MPDVRVRAATEADLAAIAAIAIATGMDDEWSGTNPDYVRHLMSHGRVVVAAAGETVLGFGAAQQIGTGSAAITMLCDLFVDPAGHGAGSGRAMLAELWRYAPRRMTFSSLHANAMPLYASFGLDAWWPLLYLRRDVRSLPRAAGWRADSASPDAAGELELRWTGADRSADYRGWAARPHAAVLTASRGQIMATEPGLLDPRRAVPSPGQA
jgi:GNAT superfamily N-acetyltransferase